MTVAGSDVGQFKDYIWSFGIFPDIAECHSYIDYHYLRFVRTLEEIPDGRGHLLEIGAAPFCMTLMMRAAREHEIHLLNYGSESAVRLESAKYDEVHEFPCRGSNVECDELPYPDGFFDVVVCAEVIEHLTLCPSHMLFQIHRVLKPGGLLIVTTPNVLRLVYRYENLRNVMRGGNFYDPYSGYGPYGRHNREFTPRELEELLVGSGFSLRAIDVLDLEPQPLSTRGRIFERVIEVLFGVDADAQSRLRGSQILAKATAEGEGRLFLPDGLYKSTHALRRAQQIFPRIP